MSNGILPRNKALNPFAGNLRRSMTKQEKHLWYDFLKAYPNRFYRQRIIGSYITDFYCPRLKLVIELDGSQHFEEKAAEYDRIRTEYLESLGITVLRFTNTEVDRHFNDVCTAIKETNKAGGR